MWAIFLSIQSLVEPLVQIGAQHQAAIITRTCSQQDDLWVAISWS